MEVVSVVAFETVVSVVTYGSGLSGRIWNSGLGSRIWESVLICINTAINWQNIQGHVSDKVHATSGLHATSIGLAGQ